MPKKPEAKPVAKAVKPAPDPRAVAAKPKVETFSNGRQDRVVYTHQRAKAS
jgi:hypothetical protein